MSETQTYRPLLDVFAEACEVPIPKGHVFGWKAVGPDLRTRNGVRWFPGTVKPNPTDREMTTGDPCPQFDGDGLCLAKTARGAAAGGIALRTIVFVAYRRGWVLGEDADKLRVSEARCLDVFDVSRASLSGAYLSGCDLSGANLSYTYLSGCDLSGADLSGCDLSGAELSGCDLSDASLSGAYLSGADLSDCDLSGANLSGCDLYGADLSGAYLSGDLSRAELYGANLSGANLSGANLGEWERGPDGMARRRTA